MLKDINDIYKTQIKRFSWINKGLLKSDLIKNVAVLFTSTTYAQFLPFVFAPLIARLYNPLDYALSAAFASITIIAGTLATGMYDVAVMLDKEDEEAWNSGMVAMLFTITISFITVLAALFFAKPMAILVKNNDLIKYLYLVPVFVFFTGMYKVLNIWTNRKKRFKRISLNRMLQASISVFLLLIFGYFNYGGKGLIYSTVIGLVFTALLLLIQTLYDDHKMLKAISKEQIRISFRKHKDFPLYNMPQALLDGLRESSILIIISNFFGPTILGSYSFAYNMLLKPLRFSGESLGQVYFQHASSEYNRTQNIKGIFHKTLFTTIIIGAPVFLILGLFGHQIFSILFGNKWIQAGFFTQILAFWLFMRFVISPISSTPIIYKRQKHFLYISTMINILPPLSLYLSAKLHYSITTSLFIFVVLNCIFYFIMMVWFSRLIKKRS